MVTTSNVDARMYLSKCVAQARVKRRSFHAPNLLQLSSTLERPWSGVKSE